LRNTSPLVETISLQVEYPYEEGLLRLYDEGLSIKVNEGDFVAILGLSGWGKSTFINVVLGLERATAGAVRFRGEDVTQKSFLKRCELVRTAAVFQRPTALPQFTVGQNLNLALSLAGIQKRDRDDRIRESLGFFGLDSLTSAYPDSLSAGQRRRIDLARALAVRPELLVIDEPTGDLDSSTSSLLLPLLRGLRSEHEISILITTAQPRCAAEANRIVRLKPPTFLTSESRLAGN
jgi:ABC-type lipoprotein export system ATPase subunit